MSNSKKLLSAAVITGLAVGGVQAGTEHDDQLLDLPGAFLDGAEDTIITFDGDADVPDVLILGDELPVEDVINYADLDFELSQTVYGGGGGDGLAAPRIQRRGTPTIQSPNAGGQRPQVNRRRQVETPRGQKGSRRQQ